jgi:dihydroxy-acid dehydratase
MKYQGPARVFDEEDDALKALKNGEIKPGDACVLRFLGLKARFGTTAFMFQEMLKGRKELFDSCAIISDGRFSGGSSGLSVGYVSPEAALMGPIGLVRDGDIITIDVPNRRIDVDADLEARKKDFNWKYDSSKYPRYLNTFVKNVGSMAHGGIWE